MSSTRYVIDLHALLELERLDCSPGARSLVLNAMTDLVVSGTLNFPTTIVRGCERYALGEQVSVWAKAVSGSRVLTNPVSDFQIRVLDMCEDLADQDDTEESSQILVAAMALQLAASSPRNVEVITDDVLPQPTRTCLSDACEMLGITAQALRWFPT